MSGRSQGKKESYLLFDRSSTAFSLLGPLKTGAQVQKKTVTSRFKVWGLKLGRGGILPNSAGKSNCLLDKLYKLRPLFL